MSHASSFHAARGLRLIGLGLALAVAAPFLSAFAEHNGSANASPMQHEEGFIARVGIEDNFTVVFHVMRAPKGMRYSREQYHLMVIVEKDGKPVQGLRLTSRVKHPNGSVEEKPMSAVGNWHMAIYNLSHEQGRHWMTVQFTLHGKKYSAGAYYPEWDFSTQRESRPKTHRPGGQTTSHGRMP